MDPSSFSSFAILLQTQASPTDIVFGLVFVFILLIWSALISGSEVAYFSLSPASIASLNEAQDARSQRVLALLEKPDRERASKWLLATILITNNFINIAIVLVSTFVADNVFPANVTGWTAFALHVVVVTFLIVLFGEVIPKIYATNNAISLARFMSFPLAVLSRLLKPFSRLLIGSTRFVDDKFQGNSGVISVDELEAALELTQDEARSSEEHKIFEGIVNFGSKDVKQIMTSRMDIAAFTTETSYSELIDGILEIGFSRIPVFTKSLDEIAGILYIKDLLPHLNGPEEDWTSLIRTPFFVPENKKIDDLLREFQEKKIHLAIVVDEYGGTSGLITLEDVIEEIVGDITDEYDDEDLKYSKLDDSNYVFEGKTPLIDIYRILNIEGDPFEAVKGESDSLAGFVIEQAGRIPLKGEKLSFEGLTFAIEAADKRKVKRIKVTLTNQAESEKSI